MSVVRPEEWFLHLKKLNSVSSVVVVYSKSVLLRASLGRFFQIVFVGIDDDFCFMIMMLV